MEIVGNGFLAQALKEGAWARPDVVALAAGVSSATNTSSADFDRETRLVDEVAERCRATGRRLLFFSTAAAGVYGAVDGPGREDSPAHPTSAYGAHKLALERRVRDSGADHLILRLTHVVGPGQRPHQLLPSLVHQVREGRITVQRRAQRDLIDIRHAVAIIGHLAEAADGGATVNVASGDSAPVERIVDRIEHRLGVRAERCYIDGGSRHSVAIDKMLSLVPQAASMGFGPGYHRRAVDAFLAATGATPAAPAPRSSSEGRGPRPV